VGKRREEDGQGVLKEGVGDPEGKESGIVQKKGCRKGGTSHIEKRRNMGGKKGRFEEDSSMRGGRPFDP